LLVGLHTPKECIHTLGPTLFLEYSVLSNHTVSVTNYSIPTHLFTGCTCHIT